MKQKLPNIASNNGKFTDGNPATGQLGTRVTAAWLNDVQDRHQDFYSELANVLALAGYQPDPTKVNQVAEAIKAYLQSYVNSLTRNIEQRIPNSKKSNAVDSNSADTVATSAAVKTAYDQGSEALNVANAKWTQQRASDSVEGTTVLSHKINGVDKTKAASEYALGEVAKTALPIGAVLAFPQAIKNPSGFLKADGTTFNQSAFPDLYHVLGGNKLPNLTRTDVGVLAYFPFDEIPTGWLICNGQTVRQQDYPELYQKLGNRYGVDGKLPDAQDRFIRNAGNGLRVGEIQEDAIRNIIGEMKADSVSHGNTQFVDNLVCNGAFEKIPGNKGYTGDYNGGGQAWGAKFDASKVVPTAKENRPKSIVFKLCIKAINQFDDVAFWIKAAGTVANQGLLDASKLAQDLQNKANLNHTHRASEIVDFSAASNNIANQAINAAFTYQQIGGFEVRKYADGTMIQSYTYEIYDLSDWSIKSFNWAVAFVGVPMIIGKPTTSHRGSLDCGINILTTSNNAKVEYALYEHSSVNQGLCRIQFFAIGRWK